MFKFQTESRFLKNDRGLTDRRIDRQTDKQMNNSH